MRLIDADALINELYDFEHEHTYIDDNGDLIVFEVPTWVDWLISVAPTLEAIPVDWLRKHRKQTRYKRAARIIEQLVRLYQEEQER